MAVLRALPELSIIDGLKGSIDFYVHRGIPCARRWPRPPSGPRSPAVQAAGVLFSQAASAWSRVDPLVKLAANAMALGSPMTGKDVLTSILLGGTYDPTDDSEDAP